jgi:hypothetical protein
MNLEDVVSKIGYELVEYDDHDELLYELNRREYPYKDILLEDYTDLCSRYSEIIGFHSGWAKVIAIQRSLQGQARKSVLIHEMGHALFNRDHLYTADERPHVREKYFGAKNDEEWIVDQFSQRVLSNIEPLEDETIATYYRYALRFEPICSTAVLEYFVQELLEKWDRVVYDRPKRLPYSIRNIPEILKGQGKNRWNCTTK